MLKFSRVQLCLLERWHNQHDLQNQGFLLFKDQRKHAHYSETAHSDRVLYTYMVVLYSRKVTSERLKGNERERLWERDSARVFTLILILFTGVQCYTNIPEASHCLGKSALTTFFLSVCLAGMSAGKHPGVEPSPLTARQSHPGSMLTASEPARRPIKERIRRPILWPAVNPKVQTVTECSCGYKDI